MNIRILGKADITLYKNIPPSVKQFPNWICYNELKQPYQVNGHLASSTDPLTWNSFDNCVEALNGKLLGVALVNTNIPITFLDMDKTDDPEILKEQIKIFNSIPSYGERSPSGTGARMIVIGKLPHNLNGFKNNKGIIQVMSNNSYCTITGDVVKNVPVTDCTEQLQWLFDTYCTSKNNVVNINADELAATLPDEELIAKICSAVNGEQFRNLYYNGYPDGADRSSIDQSFMNFVAFYLGLNGLPQATRIIKSSKLYVDRINGPADKRKKLNRPDYINSTYQHAINKPLAPVAHIEGLKEAFQAFKPTQEHIHTSMTPDFFRPLGLLGEIAQFVYDDSPRQIAEAAFLAADCFIGGIGGRAFNISGTGLNQYNLLLAETGYGKGAVENCIDRLVHFVIEYATVKMYSIVVSDFKLHIGPTFASGQGLIAQLGVSNCFSSTLDEFGLLLARISDDKANGADKAFYSNLLQLYNKSGYLQTFKGVKYSKKDNDLLEVKSPNVTLALLSTPSAYTEVLKDGDFRKGLIPRIFTIAYKGDRPPLNLNAHKIVPSEALLEKICQYMIQCVTITSANKVCDVEITDDMKLRLDAYVGNKIREAKLANQFVVADLWSRADMKVMKKAALFATCLNPFWPKVTDELLDIALKLIEDDLSETMKQLTIGGINISADSGHKAQLIIGRFLARYLNSPFDKLPTQKHAVENLHASHIIARSYLQKSVDISAVAKSMRITYASVFNGVIDELIKSGYISKVSVKDYAGECYKINHRVNVGFS